MASIQVVSTAMDFLPHESLDKDYWPTSTPSIRVLEAVPTPLDSGNQTPTTYEAETDSELKLPDYISLFIVLSGNALAQISFFIIVSSASAYAEFLGGTATFSGLTIGIPTICAGIALIPMVRLDRGQYKMPLNIGYTAMILGNIVYALAYRTHFLYLILIGRMISGIGFTSFMYSKRYCSDPRIVGVRRRTTLASWLVVGQGFGFSAGPFLGGLLFKIGFNNSIFNGYTSPAWVMAGAWAIFLAGSSIWFKDVPSRASQSIPLTTLSPSSPVSEGDPPLEHVSQSNVNEDEEEGRHHVTRRQWGVIFTMMWYAMTCFFILGAWESNIPVYSKAAFGYSPYNAGNFIAVGGISTFPFLLVNVWNARRLQDRVTLAVGSSLGLAGILIMLALIQTGNVIPGTFYVCWFLVALGFNLASTCTLSLLSKQLPPSWNGRTSLAIQYSNYTGRVTGAVWGGAGVQVGMMNYLGLQIGVVGIGVLLHLTLWRELKTKTG